MYCNNPDRIGDIQPHCRCHVNASPPLNKMYPDPYRGTRYENDSALCYGMLRRPFPGCGYPYKGTIPGQYGIWGNPPHSSHYPWKNPDWPCPSGHVDCCEEDCDFHHSPSERRQPRCYSDIPDGTVTGNFSACCCSEYYSACDPVCRGEFGREVCGCWPYDEPERTPLCQVADGSTIRVKCPNTEDYFISGINKDTHADSRGGIHLCGDINIYYSRDADYTFCGGYKYRV